MGWGKNGQTIFQSIDNWRVEKKEERIERRETKKDNKHERKMEKREEKHDFKLEKIQIKQDGRSERAASKWDAKTVAYSNGIDPNGAMWDNIGSSVNSVAGAAGSIFGGGGTRGTVDYSSTPSGTSLKMDLSQYGPILGIVAAVLILVFIIFKKK